MAANDNRLNVCIIGSGNWATTIARNVANNTAHSPLIESKVNMFVYQEIVDGRKLTEIINSTHINVKYMPDFLLPENIVSVPSSLSCCSMSSLPFLFSFVSFLCSLVFFPPTRSRSLYFLQPSSFSS